MLIRPFYVTTDERAANICAHVMALPDGKVHELLEQVLASNPDIVALEEKGLLIKQTDDYLTSVPALDTLATLSGRELDDMRRDYWQRVRENLPETTAKI